MVNRFGNRGRASKSKAEIDRWAVAYQRLERESECGRKEQAERSERQKRRLLRTLHSQQLHLGTTSRAMRDRLTRRYQRSLSRAQNEATGLRKELRKVQTKLATIDPNESHGLIAHLPWQYDHAKLIIIKQSSTITRTKARVNSAAEMLDEDSVQTTLIESGSKAIRPARRSSVSQMERLQDITARPLAPLRRRSVSAATPISGADPTSPIPSNAESRSLREIVTMLRLVYGYGSSQPGQDGSGPPQDNGCDKEACSTPSQNGDGPGAEDDGTRSPYYGQRPTVFKGRTNRRRRKAEGVKDVETADAQ